jgi:hypothetical protein
MVVHLLPCGSRFDAASDVDCDTFLRAPPRSPLALSIAANSKVEVTFYKNGFTIDDDDTLHSLDAAGVKAFVADVEKG